MLQMLKIYQNFLIIYQEIHHFLYSSLYTFTNEDTMNFFEE